MNLAIEQQVSVYPKKIFLGTNIDNRRIYLFAPSWDCDWYWGFGYLGNTCCHYHVDGLKTDKGIYGVRFRNLFDGFKEHFKTFIVKDDKDLWRLCDLFSSFYTLRKTAELYYRGCSNYTEKKNLNLDLTDMKRYKEINEVLIPKIFKEIYEILLKYKR